MLQLRPGDLDTLEALRLQSLSLAGTVERSADIDERISTWRIRLLAIAGRTIEAACGAPRRPLREQSDDAGRGTRSTCSTPRSACAKETCVGANTSVIGQSPRGVKTHAEVSSVWLFSCKPGPGRICSPTRSPELNSCWKRVCRLCDGISPRLIHVSLCVLRVVELAYQHGFLEEAEQRLESHLDHRGGVSGTVLEPHFDTVRARITDALTAQSALPFGQVLSAREMTVLAELSTHLQGREIAERLYVSTNTLKTHTKAIYRKLGTTSRSESVAVAKSLGLIP